MDSNGKIIAIAVVALLVGGALGAVIGVVAKPAQDNDDTYYFYVYFGEGNAKNNWYSAKASDAAKGFEKAMNDAKLSFKLNSYKYISEIDGNNGNGSGWYIAQYLYKDTNKAAADASILYPTESYGTLRCSNGWISFSGYDSNDYTNKIGEANGTIYFLSPYNMDYSAPSPASVNTWMTTGPFKA